MSALRTLVLGLAAGLMAATALAAAPSAVPKTAPKAERDPEPPGMLDEKSVAQWVAKNLKGEGWVLVNYDAEGVRLATPEGVALMSDGLVETDIRHELFTPIALQAGTARSGLAHWAVDCAHRQFAVLSSVAYAHNNLAGPVVVSRKGDRRLFQEPVASENDTLDAVCEAIRSGKRLHDTLKPARES